MRFHSIPVPIDSNAITNTHTHSLSSIPSQRTPRILTSASMCPPARAAVRPNRLPTQSHQRDRRNRSGTHHRALCFFQPCLRAGFICTRMVEKLTTTQGKETIQNVCDREATKSFSNVEFHASERRSLTSHLKLQGCPRRDAHS